MLICSARRLAGRVAQITKPPITCTPLIARKGRCCTFWIMAELDEPSQTITRPKKQQKQGPKPDFFLALRVASPRVQDSMLAVQRSIEAHSPHMRGACVDVASSHLTLAVLHLPTEDDRQRAVQLLLALHDMLAQQSLLRPVHVTMAGLSHFANRVSSSTSA
jgi:hypothetical protein